MSVDKSKELARRWMSTVALQRVYEETQLLAQCPQSAGLCWPHIERVAWLNGITVHGQLENGSRVTPESLCAEGVCHLVVEDLLAVTRQFIEPTEVYFARLSNAS